MRTNGRVAKVVLVALVPAACSSLIGFSGTAYAKATSGHETISFLSVQDSGKGKTYFLQNVVVPAFEKKYPNISVNVVTVPWDQYDVKLSTMTAAGTPPDVFIDWGTNGFADYYHRGMVGDLTPYFKQSKWSNPNIPKQLIQPFQINNQLYAVPMDWFPSLVMYNKAVFKQAGVPALNYQWGDPKWTWSSMIGIAKKLTKSYGNPDAVYGLDFNQTWYDDWGYDWGTQLYTNKNVRTTGFATGNAIDGPQYTGVIQTLQNLIYKDKVSPTPAISQAVASGGDPFLTGKIGMEIGGAWLLGNAKQVGMKIGVAPIPLGPAKTATSVKFTDYLMMAKKTKSPDAASKLIAFMASYPMQKAWADTTGYLPADTVAAKDWYGSFTQSGISASELKSVTQQALGHSVETISNMLVGYSQISSFLTNNLQPIFTEDKSPASVLPKLKAPFNKLLGQIRQNGK